MENRNTKKSYDLTKPATLKECRENEERLDKEILIRRTENKKRKRLKS